MGLGTNSSWCNAWDPQATEQLASPPRHRGERATLWIVFLAFWCLGSSPGLHTCNIGQYCRTQSQYTRRSSGLSAVWVQRGYKALRAGGGPAAGILSGQVIEGLWLHLWQCSNMCDHPLMYSTHCQAPGTGCGAEYWSWYLVIWGEPGCFSKEGWSEVPSEFLALKLGVSLV